MERRHHFGEERSYTGAIDVSKKHHAHEEDEHLAERYEGIREVPGAFHAILYTAKTLHEANGRPVMRPISRRT